MPLTTAADLPNHPSLSIPYTSTIISDMAQQACEMVHRERKTLWSVKHLLTRLRGDDTWIPCETLDDPDVDEAIFGTAFLYNGSTTVASRGGNVLDSVLSGNSKESTHTQNSHTIELEPDVSHNVHDASHEISQQEFEAVPETEVDQIASINHEMTQRKFEVVPPIEVDQIIIEDPTAPNNMKSGTTENLGKSVTRKIDVGEAKTQAVGLTAGEGDPAMSQFHSKDITNNEEGLGAAENAGEASKTKQPSAWETGQQEQISNFAKADILPPPAEQIQEPIANEHADDQTMPDAMPQEPNDLSGAPKTTAGNPPATTTNAEPPPKPEHPKDPTPTRSTSHSSASHPPPHRMLTRAQAAASTPASPHTTPAPTRSPSPPPYIHPLYLAPASAHPSRDLGLPPAEAEETRRICTLWVQKQEEVVRGAESLYEGLLKADRMRKNVWKWCKAEGHVGEMSDGEDWYDREEWGLEGELRKGNLEEEEEVGETRGKRGRGRRGI